MAILKLYKLTRSIKHKKSLDEKAFARNSTLTSTSLAVTHQREAIVTRAVEARHRVDARVLALVVTYVVALVHVYKHDVTRYGSYKTDTLTYVVHLSKRDGDVTIHSRVSVAHM